MNITFLIGNGFDLNQNKKTSYQDFYNYYLNIDSPKKDVSIFKKDISEDISSWADLELKFGEYTKKIEREESFYHVLEDLIFHISEFIKKQEIDYNLNEENEKKWYIVYVLLTTICHQEMSDMSQNILINLVYLGI